MVVVGAAADRALTAAVTSAIGPSVLDISGRLSLGGLAALLAQAAVVIGNDSGPLHLAEAVGASTVGIYWCGNLVNADPMTRTRHRPVPSWRLDCPVCGRNCITESCSHQVSFVADVPVQEVLEHALDLLGGSGP